MIEWWNSSILRSDMVDWVTVAAYLFSAVLAFYAAKRAGADGLERERLFWRAMVGLLVFLGVNELLDLQSLLTILGRDLAKSLGWYEQRRTFQLLLVLGFATIALFAAAYGIWFTRNMGIAVRTSLIGVVAIGLFAFGRAAHFNHVQAFLADGAHSFPFGSIQELIGVFIVGASAFAYVRLGAPANHP